MLLIPTKVSRFAGVLASAASIASLWVFYFLPCNFVFFFFHA